MATNKDYKDQPTDASEWTAKEPSAAPYGDLASKYMPYPSEDQLQMTFVVSCIGSVAKSTHRSTQEVYEKMKHANMINDYLFKHYDVLHTESRENLTQELIALLQLKEGGQND